MVWAVPGEEVVVGEGRLHQSKSVSLFLFFLAFVNTRFWTWDGMDGRRIFRCENG